MSDRPIIVNRTLERAALRVISKATPSSKVLLGKLDESFFGNDVNRTVFRRIKQQTARRNAIPSWRDLINDPSFDNTTHTALKGFADNPAVTRQVCVELFDGLSQLRQRRILDQVSRGINEALMKGPGKIDEESIIKIASERISQARVRKSHAPPLSLGKGARYKERLEGLLEGTAIPLWPTGFTDFDRRAGGVAIGSLILIGGYTASGKGYFAGTLANNFADYGLRVGEISLEMDEDEVLLRRASALSETLQDKILKAGKEPLSEKEKAHIREALAKKSDTWARKGSGVYTHSPKEEVDIDQAIAMVEVFDYNVVILDYASLLDGVGGRDFWQKLMEVCRKGKIYARNKKAIFIILIQTDEMDNVSLSKGMLRHCDYAFVLKHSETRDEDDFTEVVMPKVRKISAAPFVIGRDLQYARFTDYKGDHKPGGERQKITTDRPGATRVSGSRQGAGGSQGQGRQPAPPVTEHDPELEAYFADDNIGDL